VSYLII